MKTCSKCKVKLPIERFGTDRSKRDGHRPDCKACQYAASDRAAAVAKAVASYRADRERILAKNKAWAEKNKPRLRELQREWTKKNLKKARAWNAKRRAARLNATPKWADTKLITAFYLACPDGYHVDHVIPLRGKLVCGLHVLENLQYLPASENLRKGASHG